MVREFTLTQLKASLPGGQLPASYGVYFKNTLIALCHALEDYVLQRSRETQPVATGATGATGATDAAPPYPLILVTFQQGKWYLQEADRYYDLAQCSRAVAIAAVADSGFAEHPTSQLANVTLVDLDAQDPLAQEWNLVILAPDYAAMVLCRELALEDYRAEQPETDTERKFYGLWTFDRALVTTTATLLIQRLGDYDAALAERLSQAQADIAAHPSPTAADLTGVITRIVTYLQTSQQQLVTVNRQARELWELEGRALRLNRNLAANKLQAFLRMAQRVDERDRWNPVASLQVAALSETLGQLLDLPTLNLRRLRLAGLLFRIGLAEAPSEVFTQMASDLDDASLILWRDRAQLSAQLLAAMPELEAVTEIVRHHLEHWDGSGRPEGLKGDAIPLESRILGLVAYFQEMTQARGDRPALSLRQALEKCQERSGKRFDPGLLEVLSHVIRLTELGMMQLPDRPSQLPPVWLEDTPVTPTKAARSEVSP
ncbi:histidine kinase [Trichothermofontia sichuanensis B231]|uniref:HD domain-containing phosphohydrolase n=1 Tax=Trichothermofontia sichuanensis TaxID=3045816 RepID=UPI0022462294|nr:HD domain-containing phosphohydrolase [Trichothermofontia sichuanensis]UZQ55395.1 histidine kinase [Trichothermofontia sichuanensis B231]